jgi:hypothetical protein
MMSERWPRSLHAAAFLLAACGNTAEALRPDRAARADVSDRGAAGVERADAAQLAEELAGEDEGARDGVDPAASEPAAPRYPEVAPLAVIPVATEPYDPARTPPVPPPGADGILALGWEPLSAWKYVPERTPLPAPLEAALDGQRVRIVGHLFPILDHEKPKEFVIMRQGWQCCLIGRPPELNEVIRVVVPEERRRTLPGLLLEVEGEDFQVEEVVDDGFVVEIYTLTLVSLRAVPEGTPTERPAGAGTPEAGVTPGAAPAAAAAR